MVMTLNRPVSTNLSLRAITADELMTENPISIGHDAGVREAIALMTDRAFTVAPVIDATGQPVGVVSLTDILIHNREYSRYLNAGVEDPEQADRTTVHDIMTPAIIVVRPETTAAEVVRSLLKYRVHHLFVADDQQTLIGVISMGDVLRNLA
jgi:CBS domain-containing membrane protein